MKIDELPVTKLQKKCPWKMKSARDNFWNFARDITKSARDKPVVFYPIFSLSPAKVTVFYFLGKVHRLFIHSKTDFFFARKKGKKYSFFVNQEKSTRHSFIVWWGFNHFIKKTSSYFFEIVWLFSCYSWKSSHVVHKFDLRVVFSHR